MNKYVRRATENLLYNSFLFSLQRAANDIDHFKALPFKPSESKNCDIAIDTPTIIMDLDFSKYCMCLYQKYQPFFFYLMAAVLLKARISMGCKDSIRTNQLPE